jgi:hypothetical protein
LRLKRLDFCEQVFGLNDNPFWTLLDERNEVACFAMALPYSNRGFMLAIERTAHS